MKAYFLIARIFIYQVVKVLKYILWILIKYQSLTSLDDILNVTFFIKTLIGQTFFQCLANYLIKKEF